MKLGRNDPCWCNSGKKYKYCHLGRESQKRITLQDAIKEKKKALEKKCFHPEANVNVCNQIIKAHSIQRATVLQKISRNQHVYSFSSGLGDLFKNDGTLLPKLIGINQASTFTGFCNYHDTETFKPIETNAVEITNEHIFLIAYRSLCKELYAKKYQSNMIPFIKESDKGLDLNSQLEHQKFLETYKKGVEAGLNDLVENKKVYDNLLISKNYDDVIYYVIETEDVPEVVVSGQIHIVMDFNGRVLQTPEEIADFSKNLNKISFSILMNNSTGLIIFSCFKYESKSIEFLKSIETINDIDLPDAIIRFVFEFFENTFISPDWWEGLSMEIKSALIERMNYSIDFIERPNNTLMKDGNHYVSWEIVNRYKNF